MPLLTYVNIEKDTVFLNQMRSFSNQNCLQNFENYKKKKNKENNKLINFHVFLFLKISSILKC